MKIRAIENSASRFAIVAWLMVGAMVGGFLSTAADAATDPTKTPKTLHVYIGKYAKADETGIAHYLFDLATGKLTEVEGTSGIVNPSFLAIHPNRRFLYAVSETDSHDGQEKSGGVVAFAIDPSTGNLKKLNSQPSGGTGPCYVSLDQSGKCLMVANYGGGSVSAYKINERGELSPPTAFIQHATIPSPKGDKIPHAHSINPSPDNRFAFAADLGLDQVLAYKLDAEKGTLTPHDPPFAKLALGSGPRHLAFHTSGKFVYVINETNSTVTAFSYQAEKGELKEIQSISTLPAEQKENWTAEVQVHPSGKFLYGSNRGHNSIAVFKIDPATGMLAAAGHQSQEIKFPRNFGIDPTGKFALVASHQADHVQVFSIDPESGMLQPTGVKVAVARQPVCVKFLNLEP